MGYMKKYHDQHDNDNDVTFYRIKYRIDISNCNDYGNIKNKKRQISFFVFS
jgi:hypothetical protein